MRLLFALALLSASIGTSQAAEPAEETQYVIDVAFYEGDPLGSRDEGTLKLLAQPRLITLAGQDVQFLSGGQVLVGGEHVSFGLLMKFKCKPTDDGQIRLNATTELGERIDPKDETVVGIQSEKVVFSRTMKPGQTIKFRVGKPAKPEFQKWVEMTVRVAPINPE